MVKLSTLALLLPWRCHIRASRVLSLGIVLVVIPVDVFCQQVTLHGVVGINSSEISGSRNTRAMIAGTIVDFEFAHPLGFEFDVLYSPKGAGLARGNNPQAGGLGTSVFVDQKVRLAYLEISVLPKLRPLDRSAYALAIYAGPSFALLLNCARVTMTETISLGTGEVLFFGRENTGCADQEGPVDLSGTFGMSFTLFVGPTPIMLSSRYVVGFLKSLPVQDQFGPLPSKNRTFSVMLSLGLKLI